jgi:hypothetical protein
MRASATKPVRPDAEPHDAAERSACLSLIEGIHERLSAIDIDEQDGMALVCGDAIRLELRRIEAVIESVRQGLHRTTPTERTDDVGA